MSEDPKDKTVKAEIIPPGRIRGGIPVFDGAPVANVTVMNALFGAVQNWGAARTLRAYRRVIQETTGLRDDLRAELAARTALEIEAEKWLNIDKLKEAKRNEIEADLAKSKAAVEDAEIDLYLKRALKEDAIRQLEEARKPKETEKKEPRLSPFEQKIAKATRRLEALKEIDRFEEQMCKDAGVSSYDELDEDKQAIVDQLRMDVEGDKV